MNANEMNPRLRAKQMNPRLRATQMNPSLRAKQMNPSLRVNRRSPSLQVNRMSPSLRASRLRVLMGKRMIASVTVHEAICDDIVFNPRLCRSKCQEHCRWWFRADICLHWNCNRLSPPSHCRRNYCGCCMPTTSSSVERLEHSCYGTGSGRRRSCL